MDYGFVESHIVYPNHKSSFYYPSCHMMDYIVHHINTVLADNFYFKRAVPDYHPYVLRLYFGVMFWIQCLRAAKDVLALTNSQHQFLDYFLSSHPLESLSIPGPLVKLFKTLCSSQPEFPGYGKIYPRLPDHPGPKRRSDFMKKDPECHFLPNIPGIFALLEHLNSVINSEKPVYPRLGKHTPVTECAVVFGHHNFPPHAERTEFEKWCLVSPGLQYPCEADKKLNEAFADRYEDFNFPPTAKTDYLRELSNFFGMNQSISWFSKVKEVASDAATFFKESGTLADCPPCGLPSNQVITLIHPPADIPQAPTHLADSRSLYPFAYRLKTTARNLLPLAETAAAYSQTHIRMFPIHPFYGLFGTNNGNHGPFWDIRPIESSPADYSSYLSIGSNVKRMVRNKGQA